jgi:hypothetical protein
MGQIECKSHAENELDLLEIERPGMKEYRSGFLSLVEAFRKSEYPSGLIDDIAYHIGAVATALLAQRSVMPVGGDETEWVDMSKYSNPKEQCDQNSRNSAVFRDAKGVYYLDAITWVNEKGFGFSGWVEGYSSSCYVDALPFNPKSFRVDVRVIDEENDTCEIIDKAQLELVWTHYRKQEPTT